MHYDLSAKATFPVRGPSLLEGCTASSVTHNQLLPNNRLTEAALRRSRPGSPRTETPGQSEVFLLFAARPSLPCCLSTRSPLLSRFPARSTYGAQSLEGVSRFPSRGDSLAFCPLGHLLPAGLGPTERKAFLAGQRNSLEGGAPRVSNRALPSLCGGLACGIRPHSALPTEVLRPPEPPHASPALRRRGWPIFRDIGTPEGGGRRVPVHLPHFPGAAGLVPPTEARVEASLTPARGFCGRLQLGGPCFPTYSGVCPTSREIRSRYFSY